MKVRGELKWSIIRQHTKPSVVVAETMLQHPLQVRAACGDNENLKRTVRRVKRKHVIKTGGTGTSDFFNIR